MNEMNKRKVAPSLPPAYFDRRYEENPDPWGFAYSDYEHQKYDASIAALPRREYQSAYELGCSIGVFTARLASKCDQLLAVDVSKRAIQQAIRRCCKLKNVRFQTAYLPRDFAKINYDLIVVSEMGYYLNEGDLAYLRSLIESSLKRGGHLLMVHWTPVIGENPLTGDEVHACFLESEGFTHLNGDRKDTYRLDLLERR
jgi:SAM-dependent methyltransferase